jgi:hypothetical protein
MSKSAVVAITRYLIDEIADGQPWDRDRTGGHLEPWKHPIHPDVKRINSIMSKAHDLALVTQEVFGVPSPERILGTKILLTLQSAFQITAWVRKDQLDDALKRIDELRALVITPTYGKGTNEYQDEG